MITSTSNSHMKQIRKLRDKKERRKTGLYYVEGVRITAEAVEKNADIEELIVVPELLDGTYGVQVMKQAVDKGIPLLEVSEKVFQYLSSKDGPKGIGAVIKQNYLTLNEVFGDSDKSEQTRFGDWVALESVQDPGNLGTILRTNDAVGVSGVILLDQSTDPYDLTAIRASMGAIYSQKIIKTQYEEFLEWKHRLDFPLVGASGESSDDYCDIHYADEHVLLMGSEREGLSEKYLKICDRVVRIPMVGSGDSLNLAIATGVVLYEVFNQRRKKRAVNDRL